MSPVAALAPAADVFEVVTRTTAVDALAWTVPTLAIVKETCISSPGDTFVGVKLMLCATKSEVLVTTGRTVSVAPALLTDPDELLTITL
jgi:hypothetical protein